MTRPDSPDKPHKPRQRLFLAWSYTVVTGAGALLAGWQISTSQEPGDWFEFVVAGFLFLSGVIVLILTYRLPPE